MAAWVTVAAPAASAQSTRAGDSPDDKTAQAKALWQEANAHYAVGEFSQAAEKYQAAYKLKPDGALLYNAAQSYRLAGNNEKAQLLYKNYVMFYPNAKNVANVQQQILKLQEAIAAQKNAQTQPPISTEPASGGVAVTPGSASAPAAAEPPSSPPSEAPSEHAEAGAAATSSPPASTAESAAGAALATTTPPPAPAEQPIYKKWWLWTAVGVVVVGAVVTALVVSGSSARWSTAPDFGPGASKLVAW